MYDIMYFERYFATYPAQLEIDYTEHEKTKTFHISLIVVGEKNSG